MPHDPTIVESWLSYAHDDFLLAQKGIVLGVRFEILCFHAQQASEKALKALLIHTDIDVPRIHSIERLIDLLPDEMVRPPFLYNAARLSDYAVTFRYPGEDSPLTQEEYHEAISLAEAVLSWATSVIHGE